MDIEICADGTVNFYAAQQHWNASQNGKDKSVLETANFAGQRLMAMTDDAGGFDLHYLGFKTAGFATMEAAHRAAPEFARRVLTRMSAMVAD
ncbi:hypothetical protein [Paraburkholderia phenazinium]|uniref:Uncharacterized protein n=1 Tax=Paraburkholderia phenazinium TaxID=60549 RepID=A0A1G8BEV6_9BURK|nr:hypothetical protein [Paraburkholderia phenazinium]SDH31698.1 hypothetical protein SAMN05216466_10922 [Paraburkholderia phenazinium]